MKTLNKEMQALRITALNVPHKDIKDILNRWHNCVMVEDYEILALYFFYNKLCKDLHVLCPEFALAYSEAARRADGISNTLWARFSKDMPQLID